MGILNDFDNGIDNNKSFSSGGLSGNQAESQPLGQVQPSFAADDGDNLAAWDEYSKSYDDRQEQKFASGLITREDADPIKWKDAVETAKGLGMSEGEYDVVYDNLPEFQKQWKEKEVKRYIDNCSTMKNMCIGDKTFLQTLDDKSARDLANINFNLAVYGQPDKPNAVVAFGERVAYQVGRSEKSIQTAKLAGNVMGKHGAEREAAIALWRAEHDKLVNLPELDTSGWGAEDFVLSGANQAPIMARTTGVVVGSTLAGSGAGSVVPFFGTAAGGAAGYAAGKAGAAYLSYDIETNSMMESLIDLKDNDGKPIDDNVMDWTARAYGAVAAMIEIVPMKAVTNVVPGMKNITKVGLKNAIKEAVKDRTKRQVIMGIIKDYGLAVASETSEEMAQQLAQSEFTRGAKALMNALYGTSFEQNDILDDLAESAEAGVMAFKASTVMSGTGSALRVKSEVRAFEKENRQLKHSKEAKAQYDAQALDNMAGNIQSYMQRPSSEKATLQKYMKEAKKSSIYQDIYMSVDDARAVLISEAVQKNKELLSQSGLYEDIERQIAQADELGTPVRIGLDVYGSEIMANQELYGVFKDVVKTYENGITMNELKLEAEKRQKMKNSIEKAVKDNAGDYDYAYKYIVEQMAAGGVDQQRRTATAEFTAKWLTYLAAQTKMPIQEAISRFAPQYERSFDGSIGGGQNVQNIIATIRESAQDSEVQNLMKRAGELGKRDARQIAKILGKKLENAAAGDVQQFMRIVNAIGDMKLNIEAMSDDDIISNLDNYTKSGDFKLDIKRNDTDRAKSGLFSASEKALSDIQADGRQGDYVVVGGGRIPVNYEIVDLKDMITSHDDSGAINEAYPQELQPRDRSRSASDTQIAGIVNNFAPERVGKAEIATEGAPIITPEGFVAVGNGRAMALRGVYKNADKAAQYREYLTGKGFDINGFENPVLVRRLAMDMDNAQLKALVDDANTAGTMQYSDSENALRDAEKMSGNLLDLLDMEADIDSAANKRFLNGFFAEVVPTAERNAYLDKDDKITRKGVERVENAIVAKLLPDARMLSILVENPDNNIRKVTKELAKAAPAIIAFENDIAAGRVNEDYSIAGDVTAAVDLLKRAKDRGVGAAEFIAMRDMFEEPISSATQNMVKLFENSTGAADFLNRIRDYIRQASSQGDMAQGNMFDITPVGKAELLENVGKQSSLFQNDTDYIFKPSRIEKSNYISDLRAAEQAAGNVGQSIRLGDLPLVYKEIGIAPAKVNTNKKTIIKDTIQKHAVPMEVVENLPDLYADPIMVFAALDKSTNKNAYVAVLDAFDKDGKQMIAALSPAKNEGGYHMITSFYGRNNIENMIKTAFSEKKVKYVRDKKNSLLTGHNAYLSQTDNSIVEKADIVNKSFYQLPAAAYKKGKADVNSEAFKRWSGNSPVVPASKAKNYSFETGKSVTVEGFHGTKTKGIEIFEYDKNRQTGTDYGEAYYSTTDYDKASGYAYDQLKDKRVIEIDKRRDALKKEITEIMLKEGKNEKTDQLMAEFSDLSDRKYNIVQAGTAEDSGGEVMPIYMNFKNPLVVNADNKFYFQVYDRYFQEANSNGHDGIIVKNVIDNPRGEQRPIDVFIVFSPNQIKSVYNRGTFDPNNDNIYYQKNGSYKPDLVVTHGVTLEKLEEALNLGALPMPSLAVTKAKYAGNSNFGEIVFVGGSDVIDPAHNKDNHTFTADIYSTRKITATHEVNKDGRDYLERLTGAMSEKGLHYWVENVKQNLDMSHDATLKELFLASKSRITNLDGGNYMAVVNMTDKDKAEFKVWKNKFINEYTDRKIFEGFTPSGNRKFSPYDLNNILRLMKKENLKGSESTASGNAHALRGVWADELKSIDEIRKAKGRITDSETYKSLDNVIWEETSKLSDLLVTEEKAQDLENSWVAPDEYMIEEVLVKLKPNSNIANALKKAELRNDTQAVSAVKRYMELLKATPVQYFESKPQRAVDFSEFSGAIMPTSKEYDEAAKRLADYGLKVVRSDDGSKSIKDFENIYFQNQNIDAEALGAYTPATRKITLFRNNNLSTLIHESGHYWLDMLSQFAQMDSASDKLKQDWATVKEWLGVGDDNIITEEQHEKFARGVEAYFLTIKAPAASLKSIFEKFRKWLTSVYKDVKELNVDLNDDVVRVFDHMLASEAEIEEYKQANQFAEMLEKSSVKGLSKSELDKYVELTEQSLTAANEKHLMDKVALILKEETEAYKEKQKELKADVLEEWAQDKVNKAVYILVTGEIAHGHLDIKIKTSELQRLLGDDYAKFATFAGRPIFDENGLTLNELQDFTGLSEREVKAGLLTARQRMANFKKALQQRTHEELGDPVTYDDVQKQVVAAFWNNKRGELLDMELKTLAGDGMKSRAVSVQGFKKWAEDTISRMTVKELNPETYARQMQVAGDKAMQALNHGQRDAAIRAKIQQIRNFVLFREASDRLAEVESTLRRLKQIGKQEVNSGVDQVYQDAVRALLGRFTLSRALTKNAKERLGNLAAWILEQRANGYDIAVPMDLLEKNNGMSYAELTVDEFLTLGESVKSLVANGRAIKEYEIEGQLIEREQLLADLKTQLDKTYKTRKIQTTGKKKFAGFSEKLAPADAAILSFGDLSNRIDGYNTKGVFHNLFLRPMTESQNRENELLRLYGGKMKELQEALPKEIKNNLFENVAGAVENLGAEFTRGELISIGLNMGNLSNLQRLKDGNMFNDRQLGWVIRTLSREEWDYIQGVWDTLESMYPMLAEHHKKMSGLDMDHVVAAPVNTPYGTYRGGYFPLFYDRTPEVEARRNNSFQEALLESDYGRATTSTGYTKNRKEVVKDPIKFDLALIHRHLSSAIHDLAWRGNIRQMWNMANNAEFMAIMDTHLHESYRRQLLKLIKDLANSTNREAREMTFAEKMARNMRVARTTIGLGFRVKTAVKQLTGFSQSVAIMSRYKGKIGGKHSGAFWLMKGTNAFATDKSVREWCLVNSGELQARLNNMDANIAEAMKGVASKQSKLQKIDESVYKAAFWAIGKVDVFTAESTWYGAYLQAVKDFGYEHKDACFYADRVMIESQGSGNLKDKPAMQRANEWEKMLLMFYSPFSGMYGLWTSVFRDIRDGNKRAEAIADLAIAMCLPAWLDALVDGEQPGEDDDLAEWLKFFLLRPLAFWASTMPVARDLAGYFEFGRAQGFFSDTFKALTDVPKAFTNEKWTEGKRVNVLMNATAQIAGTAGYTLPIGGQMADWVQWLTDVAAGNIEIESPMSILWGIWRGKDGEPKK